MRILLFCFALLMLFSCQREDDDALETGTTVPPIVNPTETDNEPDMETDFVVETIIPTGTENYLNQDSDYIFDDDKLPVFEINLSQADFDKINNDPTAEEYVEASLTFEDETISPVGLRYKGSIGAFVNCLSGNNWANPSGFKTCTKLSMKVKINWDGREEKFFGLKKIQLHSMNNDPSQMRDRLGYSLFREMGVPAPRAQHARLVINGVYVGLFALIEQIDGRFTRYNFDDGKGNLYKEVWPLTSDGEVQPEAILLDNLKTNEDENPSVELIQNMAEDIVNASEENLIQVIGNWMDMDEMVKYAVVDRTIRNDDGAFHWYCNGNQCSSHNFYWYEETDKSQLHLIPWDLDNAFENIISDSNPVTPIYDDWGEITADCNPFPYGFLFVNQRSATCDKLTRSWTLYEEEYQQYLSVFKTEFLNNTVIEAKLNKWSEQVRDATFDANNLYDDAISISEWEGALENLKAQIEYARAN